MKHNLSPILCQNCKRPIINNHKTSYCEFCRPIIKQYNNVIIFLDKNYKYLSEDRKKNIFWTMFKKDFGF